MATRFYLPASGAAPITNIAVDTTSFAGSTVTGFFRAPLVTAKTSTALATKTHTGTGANNTGYCFAQWVSPPLLTGYSWSSTGWTWVFRCSENSASANMFADMNFRVVSNDGGTVRWMNWQAPGTECATTLTARFFNGSFTAGLPDSQPGDRIVIEAGYYRQSTLSFTFNIGVGDNAANDLTANNVDTGADNPWVEIANDVVFASEGTVFGNQLMMMGAGT